MEDILGIQEPVSFDESISHYEVHAHQPYTAANFNNSDEIRISIQHQDLGLLPSRSSIRIYGRMIDIVSRTLPVNTKFVNNGICHLFEDARSELNGIEISMQERWLVNFDGKLGHTEPQLIDNHA